MSTSTSSLQSFRHRLWLLAETAGQRIVGDLASDGDHARDQRPARAEIPYILVNKLPRYIRQDIGLDPI